MLQQKAAPAGGFAVSFLAVAKNPTASIYFRRAPLAEKTRAANGRPYC